MDKQVRCVHTHREDYYSAKNKNEIFPSAATWMDLEGIMLSEIRKKKIRRRRGGDVLKEQHVYGL